MPRIGGRQIKDISVLSEEEASSTYKSTLIDDASEFPINISSTDSGTQTVTVSGVDLNDIEALPGDTAEVTGSDGADGDYTIDTVDSSTQFTVEGSIGDATTGDLNIYNPPGASYIGVNQSSWVKISGTDLQEVLSSADTEIDNNIDPTEHQNLDQLVHSIAEDSYTEVTRNSRDYVVSKITWQSASKNTKIREYSYTLNNQDYATQLTVTQYDGSGNAVETVTIDYTRDSRNRVINYNKTKS